MDSVGFSHEILSNLSMQSDTNSGRSLKRASGDLSLTLDKVRRSKCKKESGTDRGR